MIEVLNPYTGAVVGTVPAARPEHVRDAFAIAKAFKPKLTRYERQQILQRTAEILRDRARGDSPASSRPSPGCAEGLALRGRPRLRRLFASPAQLTIKDDGEIFSCDITPHGKQRKIYTTREPLLGVISAITPFNHPLNMVAHKSRRRSPPTTAWC